MPNNMQQQGAVLVIFSGTRIEPQILANDYAVVVARSAWRQVVEMKGKKFVDLETLVDPGSMQEAAQLLEELPKERFANGTLISKAVQYQGYELWWARYNSLFYNFCIPFTQYHRLLGFLKDFKKVYLHEPKHTPLFFCYCEAYGCKLIVRNTTRFFFSRLSLGVILQIFFTGLSVPFLILQSRPALVFTSDKFAPGQDYDFRMKFIYEELRHRRIPFVEFVRSLESSASILKRAFTRRRPVIYSDAVIFLGNVIAFVTGGYYWAKKKFGRNRLVSNVEPEVYFKSLLAIQYLPGVSGDMWAIWLMAWLVWLAGIKVGILTATTERNFHAVLGCKLNKVPTLGILHGVASRYATPYDYMTGFNGSKMLSVDLYGVWSEWWRQHFVAESDAYKPGQLAVSGLMRPITVVPPRGLSDGSATFPRVLFVAEQTAAPQEVMPYLQELLKHEDFTVTIKFRPHHDGFEEWLRINAPSVLQDSRVRIVKGGMQEAIAQADVIVGCHSTGVLEAVLQLKVPIFLYTRKWGDYYGMLKAPDRRSFFARNPEELLQQIRQAQVVSSDQVKALREQYFGNPQQNGSVWLVDQAAKFL